MIAISAVVAVLACAWFAGDAVLGLIVAPRLFALAAEQGPGAAFAGLVFGDVLWRWVVIAGLTCVIPMAILLGIAAGRRLKQRGWRAAAVPLIAIAMALSVHVVTATTVDQGQRIASELRRHPDPERLERFRTAFHARSRLVFGLEMLACLALAIGGVVAAHRYGRRTTSRA